MHRHQLADQLGTWWITIDLRRIDGDPVDQGARCFQGRRERLFGPIRTPTYAVTTSGLVSCDLGLAAIPGIEPHLRSVVEGIEFTLPSHGHRNRPQHNSHGGRQDGYPLIIGG
jgi:hypothetical protein